MDEVRAGPVESSVVPGFDGGDAAYIGPTDEVLIARTGQVFQVLQVVGGVWSLGPRVAYSFAAAWWTTARTVARPW